MPRALRSVLVHELELVAWSPPLCSVEVRCSKGTYVRTLAEDIGEALGCGAHVAALRRTAIGRFSLEAAVSLEGLEEAGAAARTELLLPAFALVEHLPAIALSEESARRIRQGQAVALPSGGPGGACRLHDPDGEFLGLGEERGDGLLYPVRLTAAALRTLGADGAVFRPVRLAVQKPLKSRKDPAGRARGGVRSPRECDPGYECEEAVENAQIVAGASAASWLLSRFRPRHRKLPSRAHGTAWQLTGLNSPPSCAVGILNSNAYARREREHMVATTTSEKAKVIADFQRATGDTGSPEVQIALLTARINGLNDHFKANVKDHHSRRGLLRMVSAPPQAARLSQVRNTDSYRTLIDSLGLRK